MTMLEDASSDRVSFGRKVTEGYTTDLSLSPTRSALAYQARPFNKLFSPLIAIQIGRRMSQNPGRS